MVVCVTVFVYVLVHCWRESNQRDWYTIYKRSRKWGPKLSPCFNCCMEREIGGVNEAVYLVFFGYVV